MHIPGVDLGEGHGGLMTPPLPMLHVKIFENRCDVLIITRDVSAYDDVDYLPERAKQLQQIAMLSLSGSRAGRGPATKRRRRCAHGSGNLLNYFRSTVAGPSAPNRSVLIILQHFSHGHVCSAGLIMN